MKKLAIVGASYLQEPLIQKAKSKGIETHVFAWAAGDVGEKSADFFYPVSIVEKEEILNKCREIGVDGICTIASDLAVITVNYVAQNMGLVSNSLNCTKCSTNKNLMRECFEKNGDPSPKSFLVSSVSDLSEADISYPIIVKPIDRSGSRGITKLNSSEGLVEAIERAKEEGFEKKALVEEFATGKEFSVECISYEGQHELLTVTAKYTTGSPNFIEKGHLEPAQLNDEQYRKIQEIVFHALDSLGIEYGASHSEIKISETGEIKIIEIGGRMGGDMIGSSLVELSTGYDFLDAVIDIALGKKPKTAKCKSSAAAVRFVFGNEDIEALDRIKKEHPEILIEEDIKSIGNEQVTDSGNRYGYYLFSSNDIMLLKKYLPIQTEE